MPKFIYLYCEDKEVFPNLTIINKATMKNLNRIILYLQNPSHTCRNIQQGIYAFGMLPGLAKLPSMVAACSLFHFGKNNVPPLGSPFLKLFFCNQEVKFRVY
jgi:hypothetical protein